MIFFFSGVEQKKKMWKWPCEAACCSCWAVVRKKKPLQHRLWREKWIRQPRQRKRSERDDSQKENVCVCGNIPVNVKRVNLGVRKCWRHMKWHVAALPVAQRAMNVRVCLRIVTTLSLGRGSLRMMCSMKSFGMTEAMFHFNFPSTTSSQFWKKDIMKTYSVWGLNGTVPSRHGPWPDSLFSSGSVFCKGRNICALPLSSLYHIVCAPLLIPLVPCVHLANMWQVWPGIEALPVNELALHLLSQVSDSNHEFALHRLRQRANTSHRASLFAEEQNAFISNDFISRVLMSLQTLIFSCLAFTFFKWVIGSHQLWFKDIYFQEKSYSYPFVENPKAHKIILMITWIVACFRKAITNFQMFPKLFMVVYAANI